MLSHPGHPVQEHMYISRSNLGKKQKTGIKVFWGIFGEIEILTVYQMTLN